MISNPSLIKDKKFELRHLEKDLPVLKEVVKGSWNKEKELSGLKTELAAIERKIQSSIGEKEIKEVKEDKEQKQDLNNIKQNSKKGVKI